MPPRNRHPHLRQPPPQPRGRDHCTEYRHQHQHGENLLRDHPEVVADVDGEGLGAEFGQGERGDEREQQHADGQAGDPELHHDVAEDGQDGDGEGGGNEKARRRA